MPCWHNSLFLGALFLCNWSGEDGKNGIAFVRVMDTSTVVTLGGVQVPALGVQLMWLSGRPTLSVAKVRGSVPAKCQRSLLKPIRLVAKLVQLLTNAWFLRNPMSSPLVTG